MRPELRLAAAAALLLAPGAGLAQAAECRLPATLPQPAADGPSQREPKRRLPIGGYTLALSWSPEYCRGNARDPRDGFQCGGANRFGFTLHGLWPDGRGRSWPQYCRPAALLSDPVVRAALCATPSPQLLQHEWAKHGTCMAQDPASYFATSGRLYRDVAYPDMAALSRRPSLTASAFKRAFAAANPKLSPAMIRLNLDRRGWLEEVWICLGTDMAPRRCAATSGDAMGSATVRIWRGGGNARTRGRGLE